MNTRELALPALICCTRIICDPLDSRDGDGNRSMPVINTDRKTNPQRHPSGGIVARSAVSRYNRGFRFSLRPVIPASLIVVHLNDGSTHNSCRRAAVSIESHFALRTENSEAACQRKSVNHRSAA